MKDFRKTTLFVFSRVKSIIYTGNFPKSVTISTCGTVFLKNEEFPRHLNKALLMSPSYDVTIYKIKLVIKKNGLSGQCKFCTIMIRFIWAIK